MSAMLDPGIVGQIRALGGDELLLDLVALFLAHTPHRMDEFRAGVVRGDLPRAEKAIHSFRSSSVSLGARFVSEEAAEFERLAQQGMTEELRRRLPAFEAAVSRLLDELSREYEEKRP